MANHNRDRFDQDWSHSAYDSDYGSFDEEGPYAGVGPRDYRRSDQRIFEDVCQRLTMHGWIDASHIRVEVKDGEVTLTGMVDDRDTKRRVEQLVDHVHGIRDIHNQIRVQGRDRHDRDSGLPGGGQGRVEEVGQSGVHPASGPLPQRNAEVKAPGALGQGQRGAAEREESSRSETNPAAATQTGRSTGRRPKRES